ncbi:hypothetical protein [Parablautia sp. Marseille-Q6255]|uniref:hypothetical protein n=1 Tax=Parablautia sp. Marseille-Q6255 TaxID=3039593 RepID=UPI0024BCA04E|nr:hypothetical protein [Parablautia sp. Marseille-Q6255]
MLLGIITKKLRKELHDTRKLLEREKQKGKEDAQERQELEIRIWKLESELRTYQYREKHIRDVLKYEYWERIRPLYIMGTADLKRSIRLENLFFDRDEKTWGVVESYCLQCGKVLRASYFSQELEALRYLAMKQMLGIAPAFDTCMECYQESLRACA